MKLTPIMVAATLATASVWAGTKARDASIVRLTLRDGREVVGRIQSYTKGKYVVARAKGPILVVAPADLRTMVMAPDVEVAVPKPLRTTYKAPTQQELFQMAIEELRKENKAERRKRLEAAKGDLSQLGLGSVLNKIGEDLEDNLLDFVAKDKQMQDILLDETVQKSVEEKDIVSLMNNERILNLMRNPEKVKKLVGSVLGDEEEKEKTETKEK